MTGDAGGESEEEAQREEVATSARHVGPRDVRMGVEQAPEFYEPDDEVPPAPPGLKWVKYKPDVPPLPPVSSKLGPQFSRYIWMYDPSSQILSYSFTSFDKVWVHAWLCPLVLIYRAHHDAPGAAVTCPPLLSPPSCCCCLISVVVGCALLFWCHTLRQSAVQRKPRRCTNQWLTGQDSIPLSWVVDQ